MAVDPTVVKARLMKIVDSVTLLEKVSLLSFDEYQEDRITQAATERTLQLAIQSVIDIASHIVAHNRWGDITTYQGSILTLGNKGVLPKDLADSLVQFTKMRNLIVHIYLEIDNETVYNSVRSAIADLTEFVKIIQRLLDKDV